MSMQFTKFMQLSKIHATHHDLTQLNAAHLYRKDPISTRATSPVKLDTLHVPRYLGAFSSMNNRLMTKAICKEIKSRK